jgi:hypothetical protein
MEMRRSRIVHLTIAKKKKSAKGGEILAPFLIEGSNMQAPHQKSETISKKTPTNDS